MPGDRTAWAYFDTSVLVKCYVEEQGTSEAMRLIRRHTVLSSALAPIELTSALRRQEASGALTRRQREHALQRFQADRPHFTLLAQLRRARDDELPDRQRGAPVARGSRALGAVVADREMIPGAVHETLRYDPSVPVWRRVTKRPVSLGGVDLPEGAKLFLWLAASGRDASVFPEPDTFDLRRANATKTLAFGKGIHYCLGATLGRLEAQIALEALAYRFPRLRLVEGQELSVHPNISFRGPQALWVQASRD